MSARGAKMSQREPSGRAHAQEAARGGAVEARVRELLAHVASLRDADDDREARGRALDLVEHAAAELLELVLLDVPAPERSRPRVAGGSSVDPEVMIPPPAASGRVTTRRSTMARPLEGIRVLVVDDENDARDLAAMVLAQAGADVTEAASAAEALRALHRQRPDVVVSDIGMPGQDGHTLIRTIRDLPSPLGAVRAMAVTAFARSEDRHRSLDAGFDLHVVKPVDPTNLVGSVARLMGRDPTVAA